MSWWILLFAGTDRLWSMRPDRRHWRPRGVRFYSCSDVPDWVLRCRVKSLIRSVLLIAHRALGHELRSGFREGRVQGVSNEVTSVRAPPAPAYLERTSTAITSLRIASYRMVPYRRIASFGFVFHDFSAGLSLRWRRVSAEHTSRVSQAGVAGTSPVVTCRQAAAEGALSLPYVGFWLDVTWLDLTTVPVRPKFKFVT